MPTTEVSAHSAGYEEVPRVWPFNATEKLDPDVRELLSMHCSWCVLDCGEAQIPSSGCGNVSPSGCTASAANGQFKFVYGFNADGIAIDTTGNVWVADTGNNRIQEFSSAGTWLQTFPSSGCGGSVPACTASTTNGQFNTPYGIAIDSSNNIWIADTANNRVQELNSSGSFLNGIGKGYNGLSGSIGTAGTYSNGLTSPDALAISPDGTILVSAPTTLQVYNSSLQYACVVKQIAPAYMQGVAVSTSR